MQRTALMKVAKDRGWHVVHEYEDKKSGALDRNGRPDFHKLLNDAAAHKFDLVVLDLLDFHKKLKESGCALYLCAQQIDTTTPDGRFNFQVLGAAGELGRGLIRKRVQAGVTEAIENLKPGETWGRRRIEDSDPKIFEA